MRRTKRKHWQNNVPHSFMTENIQFNLIYQLPDEKQHYQQLAEVMTIKLNNNESKEKTTNKTCV